MNKMIRFEPMREMVTLREAMDRLFDDAYMRPVSLTGTTWQAPAVDMYQTDDEIIVKAALPGIKADEVQISVTGEALTLKGEIKHEEDTKEKTYHMREQRWGTFERTITLPTDVVANKANADFEDGILTIRLPKAEEVRPKTITVKANK
jgi:HSP20 family protein